MRVQVSGEGRIITLRYGDRLGEFDIVSKQTAVYLMKLGATVQRGKLRDSLVTARETTAALKAEAER